MSAVLLSIHPKWCELIAIKKKTIEVRKTTPVIEMPFKCYIYETKAKNYYNVFHKNTVGKVVGEFICDKFYQYSTEDFENADISDEYMTLYSCLTKDELREYEFSAETNNTNGLYGWNITNMKIYDEPKELSDFCSLDDKQITRPPQSWRYVKELEE